MESLREKNIKKSIDMMFKGMDDDVLKTVVLYTALCKSEEEKDAICEEIKKKKEEDLAYFNQKFEIEVNKDNAEEVLKLINPECIIKPSEETSYKSRLSLEITDVIEEEKSNDNIDANN